MEFRRSGKEGKIFYDTHLHRIRTDGVAPKAIVSRQPLGKPVPRESSPASRSEWEFARTPRVARGDRLDSEAAQNPVQNSRSRPARLSSLHSDHRSKACRRCSRPDVASVACSRLVEDRPSSRPGVSSPTTRKFICSAPFHQRDSARGTVSLRLPGTLSNQHTLLGDERSALRPTPGVCAPAAPQELSTVDGARRRLAPEVHFRDPSTRAPPSRRRASSRTLVNTDQPLRYLCSRQDIENGSRSS